MDIRTDHNTRITQYMTKHIIDSIASEHPDTSRLVKHQIPMKQRNQPGLQRLSYRVQHDSLHLPIVEGHEAHRMKRNREFTSQQQGCTNYPRELPQIELSLRNETKLRSIAKALPQARFGDKGVSVRTTSMN